MGWLALGAAYRSVYAALSPPLPLHASSSVNGGSLLGLLGVGGNETVHVHDSLLGQTLAHGDGSVVDSRLKLGGSDKSSKLKLSEAVANDLTSSELAVLSLGSIALLGSIVLAEALDSNLLSHVELVAN